MIRCVLITKQCKGVYYALNLLPLTILGVQFVCDFEPVLSFIFNFLSRIGIRGT